MTPDSGDASGRAIGYRSPMQSTLPRLLPDFMRAPLSGLRLIAATAAVWIAGAIYCSGYEALVRGGHNWPGSLVWSASSILPWWALFEWSKSDGGRRFLAGPARLALAIALVAVGSLLLALVILKTEGQSTPLALSIWRRLPAAAFSIVLIAWSRSGTSRPARVPPAPTQELVQIAPSVDWIEAADNYVELHLGEVVSMRRMTLAQAESALAKCGFVRIHRRFLVNWARVTALEGTGAAQVVLLANGTSLPVGRAFGAAVQRRANTFATSPQSAGRA